MTTLPRHLAHQSPDGQAKASLRLSRARREVAEARRQERFERRKGRAAIGLFSICFVIALVDDPSWFAVGAAAVFVAGACVGWWWLAERSRP